MNIINGNWVDLVIFVIILFFVIEGFRSGFWVMLIDFASFLSSLLLSLWFYSYPARFLKDNFALGRSLSNALGFLLSAIFLEALIGFILAKTVSKLPDRLRETEIDRLLSVVPSVGEALVLISFVLTLLMGFPISPNIKNDLSESIVGSYLVERTVGVEARLGEIFGGVIEDSLTYFTVQPGTTETVEINVEKQNLSEDPVSETKMFELVNEERKKRGIRELTLNEGAIVVARSHAKDMWERKYFGHISPEGEDVGDRLTQANISYSFAGENLALAPTVSTAHSGLMNSEGHRENILEERFTQLAIGVIDNGVYGKMFVQVFTD
jgi:uncharacterized protein YkwD/uncharacterized membrane protein required for colicin V production